MPLQPISTISDVSIPMLLDWWQQRKRVASARTNFKGKLHKRDETYLQAYYRLMEVYSVVKPTAKAISLTKGIHFSPDGPQLLSTLVQRTLNLDCSVMMGANLANEIGPGGLCEATIGSHNSEQGQVFRELFETDYFSVGVIADIEGAELAGALKNVVAVAAGFCDGCGLGQNAKAAILREGLAETFVQRVIDNSSALVLLLHDAHTTNSLRIFLLLA